MPAETEFPRVLLDALRDTRRRSDRCGATVAAERGGWRRRTGRYSRRRSSSSDRSQRRRTAGPQGLGPAGPQQGDRDQGGQHPSPQAIVDGRSRSRSRAEGRGAPAAGRGSRRPPRGWANDPDRENRQKGIPKHDWREQRRNRASEMLGSLPPKKGCVVVTGEVRSHHVCLLLLRETATIPDVPWPADLPGCSSGTPAVPSSGSGAGIPRPGRGPLQVAALGLSNWPVHPAPGHCRLGAGAARLRK